MPTLITGAGLVGTTAAARLIAEDLDRPILYDVAFSNDALGRWLSSEDVTLVKGDVTDLPDLVRAIRTHGADRIIHTAALHTSEVRDRPYAGARINLMGTMAVLEAARLTEAKRVVFCSSSTMYLGLKDTLVAEALPEDFSLKVVTEHPPSVYASLKLAAEWVGHTYRTEHGVDFVAVRLAGVFGPWKGTLSSPSQRIKRLVESALFGRPCQLTEGEMKRGGADYVYCRDAGQGAVRAAFAPDPRNRVYNLAMGRHYSIPEIIEVVEDVVGNRVDLRTVPGQTLSGYSSVAKPTSITPARAEIGYEVEFPMREAIKDYARVLAASP